MTDPTQTPADLDVLAERWCRQRGIDSTWERQSLAALLRSVREEGARQERDNTREALRWLPCLGEWASGPHCANLPEGREKCPTCRARAATDPTP